MRMGFLNPHKAKAAGGGADRGTGSISDAPREPQSRRGEEVLAEWVELPGEECPAATEQQLVETVTACRAAVADALHRSSKDYRVLCSLAQSDIRACDSIIAELRRRLDSNVHYDVLGKLDEAFAIASIAARRKSG